MDEKSPKWRILIVDDTPATIDVIKTALENEGYEIIVATSGEKAIVRAERARPDLILLDVLMPGIDGFETCRLLKAEERTREIPVVFMTALTTTENKVTGFEAGGVDYVTKPIEIEEVLARVRTHLALRHMQRQLKTQNIQLQQEVAERKRAEQEVRKLNAELEQRIEARTLELKNANEKLKEEMEQRRRVEEVLRESEELHRVTLENIMDPLFITDDGGRFTFICPNILNILGYSVDDIRAMGNISELVGDAIFSREALESLGEIRNVDRIIVDKAGKEHHYLITVKRVSIKGGTVLYSCRDITERMAAEEALRRSERRKTILNRIANIFLTIPDEEMYGEVLAVVLEAMESEFGLFGFIGNNGDLVIPSLTRGVWNECQVPDKSIVFPASTWGNSLWGRAIREKRSFSSHGPFHTPEGHVPIHHFLTAPIVFGNETIGLLSVANREQGYTEEDKDLIEGITDSISPILHARMQRDREEQERRRMENVLRESEERFRTLAEKSLVGVYIIQDELFSYVNPAFAEVFGYEQDEIMDRLGPRDLLTSEDMERVLDSIRRSTTGEIESEHLEFHVHSKDGVIRTVEVFGSHATHQGRPAVLGTLIDVTQRRKSEEKLLQASQRWAQTFDAVPDLIAIIDDNFRIVQTNKAMADRLGLTPEECTGKVCYKAVHGTEAPPSFCPHRRSLRDGKEHIAEVSEANLGGDFIVSTSPVFDSQGRMIGSVHVARDITERKRAAEELDRVSRRNRLLLDSAGEGIYGMDSGGKVTFINPVAATWLGYDPEELIGRRSHGLIHFRKMDGTPYPDEDCPICLAYRDGTIHRATKEMFWKKDGTAFPVEYTSTPILEDKTPVGAVVTFRDVTEREEIEERLQQAQKMEALGTLAGGIAHDFNNILTPIIVHTEMALEDIPKKSGLRFSLEQVLKAGERARDLVQQILAFSRQKESKRVLLKIGPIVKEVLKLLRASLPATIEIRKDITTKPWSISADPTQIHQILMNLCTNAAHAMREKGGVLEVGLANDSFDSASAAGIPDLGSGSYLKLSVADTGDGMSPEVMEHVFEPYFTTKEKGEGTGLGLAVVHGIVASLGGAVTVESEPGKGSTFHVYFPAEESEVPSSIQSGVSLPRGTERILLVDDEKSMIDAMKPMLEYLGYRVIARTSSVEALELFRSDPSRFDLLLTDQTMPNLTGTDLAMEVLRIKPGIPILLCSGFSDLVNEEKAKAMGIRGYIMKPILMKEIAVAIRRALDHE